MGIFNDADKRDPKLPFFSSIGENVLEFTISIQRCSNEEPDLSIPATCYLPVYILQRHIIMVFVIMRVEGIFFLKKTNNFFKHELGECAFQISGRYCFSFGQGWDTNTQTKPRQNEFSPCFIIIQPLLGLGRRGVFDLIIIGLELSFSCSISGVY